MRLGRTQKSKTLLGDLQIPIVDDRLGLDLRGPSRRPLATMLRMLPTPLPLMPRRIVPTPGLALTVSPTLPLVAVLPMIPEIPASPLRPRSTTRTIIIPIPI